LDSSVRLPAPYLPARVDPRFTFPAPEIFLCVTEHRWIVLLPLHGCSLAAAAVISVGLVSRCVWSADKESFSDFSSTRFFLWVHFCGQFSALCLVISFRAHRALLDSLLPSTAAVLKGSWLYFCARPSRMLAQFRFC
jgi:hypothetical protein